MPKLTFDQMNESQRQKVADALWSRERPRCQSSLIDELLKRGDVDGFSVDDLENLYPDPSDWTITQCREWLEDNGHESRFPDPDPWSMDREALVEALTDAGIECRDDETIETLREAVIANLNDGTIDGIEDWRDAVRDNAEPADVFEWWEVGSWLAERLEAEGEVVLRNDYGDWWGRCTTGQSVILDHVIQRLGAEYASWALDQ